MSLHNSMYVPRDPRSLPELPERPKNRSEDTFYYCPSTGKVMYWSTTAPVFVFSPKPGVSYLK